ncbi:MAG: MFS transporter, partial [Actinomadura rubrobrunea]|nr:MFS transporter [Actinomadura rubrobrunea]
MTQTTQVSRVAPGPGTFQKRAQQGGAGGLMLALLLLGQFMAILDVNIVNVALPTLRVDLGASGAGLQLVAAGYIIAYAVMLITGARLGDLAGHRRMFLLGVTVFAAASLACGLAPSIGWLVPFRFAQGAAAALLTPQVMSIIQRSFTGPARARALGFYSTVIAGGVVAGQVAGGL